MALQVTDTAWMAVIAFLGLFLAVSLHLAGRSLRVLHGLGEGKTVSLDKVTLTSRRLGLTGRPDRIIRTGGMLIIEEWKSARKLKPWHLAQMGVYFLLVEDQLGIRPSHGFVVTGDGSRHRIENEKRLQGWVLDMASEICNLRII